MRYLPYFFVTRIRSRSNRFLYNPLLLKTHQHTIIGTYISTCQLDHKLRVG